MSKDQVVFVAAAFLILLAITLAAQFRWLPNGRARSVIIFLSGTTAVLALRAAEMPPAWFAGSTTGFGVASSFIFGSCMGRGAEEKAFGFPLLLGMGLTLGIANVVAFVHARL